MKHSTAKEISKIESINIKNANVLSFMSQESENINSNYQLIVDSLKDWVDSNKNVYISYFPNCSSTNQSYIDATIGSDSLQTSSGIVNSASLYTSSTNKRVGRLTDFNIESSVYNADYIINKLDSSQQILNSVKNNISINNISSIQDFQANLDEVAKCLNVSYVGYCKYGKSAGEIFGIYKLY